MFSNTSIIPTFVSVMSKTVKPSWSFPVLEASMASSTNTTVKSPSPFLCKDMKGRIRIGLFEIVVKDASSFAKRISWLKIEPKVLIFPCKSSRFSATFTHTTIRSPSPFLCKDMKGRIRIRLFNIVV